ncbi:MAG: hypothetical protein WBG92_23235, partial [Thiohalocapsa sp.]
RKIDRSPLADGDRVRILKFSLVITTDAKARQAASDEIIPPTYKVWRSGLRRLPEIFIPWCAGFSFAPFKE